MGAGDGLVHGRQPLLHHARHGLQRQEEKRMRFQGKTNGQTGDARVRERARLFACVCVCLRVFVCVC